MKSNRRTGNTKINYLTFKEEFISHKRTVFQDFQSYFADLGEEKESKEEIIFALY